LCYDHCFIFQRKTSLKSFRKSAEQIYQIKRITLSTLHQERNLEHLLTLFFSMNKSEHIQQILQSLPDKPGVYQYYDEEGKLLYIGKAKSLKKRVTSYFNRDQHENNKTTVMVKKVNDINFIIVNTELDALLLENSLIKKHQPRYNVMLKDDKTYPWICIKKERFPRVFSTRTLIKDGSEYFGPYPSGRMMHAVLELIHKLYPLRSCNLNLTEENITKKKFKICLEYHIGNCKGPCEALQSEEEYNSNITLIRNIVKGNISSAIKQMKTLMNIYSENLEFEKAQLVKEKIDLLENYQSKSTVVSPTIENADVFSIVTDEGSGYVNYLKVMNGAIIQGHTLEMKKKLEESPEELLTLAIAELRLRFDSNSKEIIVPFIPELKFEGTEYIVPQRGDKKHLLELSERNVEYYRKEKERRESLVDPERHTKRIMQQMMKDLRLKEEPLIIECFDNSNIQGAYPVAAMTVFKNGKPSKKDYRHFNIKTVEGPDDFASMEEVIYRRYKRVLDEQQPLPQLIVVDGGKGQLSSAVTSLEKLGLMGKLGIIGIAKKLEEIYYPGDSIPMYLDKKSETLKIIQQIRDEAHRFGITHHRNRRSKGTIKTELTEIPGISNKTAEKLLQQFKSVKGVKEASLDDISKLIGISKAQLVKNYYK
jgi:excinuclease ABC subunit C